MESSSAVTLELSVQDNASMNRHGLASSEDETIWEKATSCRWILAYMGFFCYTVFYGIRTSMSIAIICMVKMESINQTVSVSQCAAANGGNRTSAQEKLNPDGGLEWDKSIQGWVLSSYFYGYLLTQVGFGYLAGRFGGKRILLIGMLVYGTSTIFLPLAVRFNPDNPNNGVIAAIVIRVVSGMAAGSIYPTTQNLWGRWAPPFERSRLTVFSSSGQTIGNVLVLGLGGFLCEWKDFDGGWPGIFYISGSLCLVFCLMWTFLIYDSPLEHPRISQKEKDYILGSLKDVELTKNKTVPWRKIVTSMPVWALTVSNVCSNFGDHTLTTKLPAYMKEVLGLQIITNGLYSVLPNISSFIVANTVANIIDTLRRKQILTTTVARKLAMFVALMIPAGILVAVGHIPCDLNYVAIILLTVAVGCTGFRTSGHSVNAQDIAAKYAGEIFGITNTFATIPGLIAPSLINYMTNEGTQEEWQNVFYVWAGIYCFGALFYMTFASGEAQKWSKSDRQHM